MVQQSKRLLSYPAFIVLFAYTARMAVFFYMSYMWHATQNPVRAFLPYGYELGLVARSIAAGHGFSSPLRFGETGPTAWFTPIYPYLTAGVFKIWGIFSDESRLIIETLNCVFGALTVIPIYGIANRVFGKNVASGAAWAWVFLPASFFFAITWIWDTALAALFLALIFWATLAMREANSIWPWAGYGALWVTGVLINPSLLSLFPFLAGWALWQSHRDSLSRVKFSAATLLVFAIGLAPWTVRNYRVFGKFIVLRSNFGLELWLGNNPDVPDTWSPWLHPNDSLEEAEKYKRMGEIAFMAAKEHEAFLFMRTHPSDTLEFHVSQVHRQLAGHYRQSGGCLVGKSASPESIHRVELAVVVIHAARSPVCASFKTHASGPLLDGSPGVSAYFLFDPRFPALSFPDGSHHDGSGRVWSGLSHFRVERTNGAASGCRYTCAARIDSLNPIPSHLSGVIFFGVMPERAVGHLEQFRRARPHAVARFQCRHNVGPFHVLNILFQVDATFRNIDMAVDRSRRRRISCGRWR